MVEVFRKDSKVIDILTKDELNRLLKIVKLYSMKSYKHLGDYVLLHLLIDGIFRITETLLLSPLDIDHANKTTAIHSNNTKSQKARVVPLSNKAYRQLMQLLEENEAFEDAVDNLIFLSLGGKMP
ncbi:tyrosine-type recombinase/integrase [Bacillus cereus]|uniref:tyrosine-type recombinase/integrase n=1 Tax=Bacillus cereus TaxID=1396 RepID=UPI001F0AE460|nr:tyrosine-type recombinase/integrase [Bacillus cereus]MCU5273599.1 site-specific integrase [Bacillus cereus]